MKNPKKVERANCFRISIECNVSESLIKFWPLLLKIKHLKIKNKLEILK